MNCALGLTGWTSSFAMLRSLARPSLCSKARSRFDLPQLFQLFQLFNFYRMFRGTFTALVTPFRNGAIDVGAAEKLIENQIAAGITGIVAVGTTGESPTLSHEERQ